MGERFDEFVANEPRLLAAVVVDCVGVRWTRATVDPDDDHPWYSEQINWANWTEVGAVEVLREGLAPAPCDAEWIADFQARHEPLEGSGGGIDCTCGWPNRTRHEIDQTYVAHIIDALPTNGATP